MKNNGSFDWSVSSRTRPGEKESGDQSVVVSQRGGALLAVADGLGHGVEAAHAATIATRCVEESAGKSLIEIVNCCHKALLRTRGVALSLARWESQDHVMTWLGVGNVEGLLLQGEGGGRPVCRRLVLRGGVVGVRLPALQEAPMSVPGQAMLILATDGIADGFEQGLSLLAKPKSVAEQIVSRFARDTDDATVLVARLQAAP